MKKIIITTLFTIFLSLYVLSQSDLEPKLNWGLEKDVRSLLIEKYSKIKLLMEDSCFQLCIYLKFQIDSNGGIKEVYTSYSNFPMIDSFLCQSLRTSNGRWYPRILNGKKTVSKKYVLPIFFELTNNCFSSNYTVVGAKNILTDNRILKGKQLNFAQYFEAETLECVLLNPLVFTIPFRH